MSPFIVTTKRPGHDAFQAYSQGGTGVLRVCECGMQSDMAENDGDCPYAVSRRAVASLEGAARVIYTAAGQQTTPSDWSYDQCLCKLPESGGSVGPLPDGTVIQVEARTWEELATDAGVGRAVLEHMGTSAWSEAQQQILNVFNAREAGR